MWSTTVVGSEPTMSSGSNMEEWGDAHENEREKAAAEDKALAQFYIRNGDKSRAADLFSQALEQAPQLFIYKEKISVAKLLMATNRRQDAIEVLEKIVKEPHNGFEAELLLANALSSDEENKNDRTSKFYLHAIRLAPQKFNYDEKIAIAKLLIKLQQRHEALALLQNMVNEPHNGLTAELMLAKLRVFTGEYDAALNDANEILQRDKKNSKALLIKGGELRRRKAFGDAISAYNAILARKDDFDARLGLVYSLLAIGKKQEAEKHFKLLHAQDKWQQYDYKELARYIDVNVRPVIEYIDTKFSDSDNYNGTEQDFTGKFNFYNWDFSLSARHRSTTGEGLTANADTGILYVGKNISENWRLLTGLGITNLNWKDSVGMSLAKSYSIGEIRFDTQIWRGSAQLSYSKQMLTSNVTLVQNEVVVKTSSIVYAKSLYTRLTLKALYRYKEYSDDNTSKEYEGTMLFALNRGAPQFSVGYAYRNLDFFKPTTVGYFDPQKYEADKLLFLAAYERRSFYLYAEYLVGRQAYFRNQKPNQQYDTFNHSGVTTGMTLFKGLRMEFSLEKDDANDYFSDYVYGDSAFSWRLSYTL